MDTATLILFGITGDLAYKKLFPALYELANSGVRPRVVGVARSEWTDEDLRNRARDALGDRDSATVEDLCGRLSYLRGNYQDAQTYKALGELVPAESLPVSFLAIPPSLFDDVATGLAAGGLARGRIVVEKPFGRNVASAIELNDILHRHFPEESIFRIDHFLGKEAIQNLLVFRFANAMLEAVWNRNHIRRVTITMAESFDIGGRAGFYDGVGAIRDVVQNHLLQMVALLAMEPPIDASVEALRDEKVKVLRSIRPVDPACVIRGRYEGYADEEGVATDSTTETFAAMELFIDSWRWKDVPFSIRTGKALAETVTEAIIEFAGPPTGLFGSPDEESQPSLLRFRMKPDNRISMTMQAKVPGERMVSAPVDLAVDYGDVLGGSGPDAYERLIGDALEGDARHFARQDGVEASWRIVEPILDLAGAPDIYPLGSWGPATADAIAPLPPQPPDALHGTDTA